MPFKQAQRLAPCEKKLIYDNPAAHSGWFVMKAGSLETLSPNYSKCHVMTLHELTSRWSFCMLTQ